MNSNSNKSDLLEASEKYCLEKTNRPHTNDSYKRIVKIFLRDTGVVFPDEISTEILLHWRDQVIDRGCTTTTYNTYHRHIRAVLNYCVRKKILQENPIEHVQQFRRKVSRGKACSEQDLRKLCRFLQADTDNPLAQFTLRSILTLYYSGIRCAQLCGLEWRDIDFEEDKIFCQAEYSKTGEKYSIALHGDLREVLFDMKLEAASRFRDLRPSSQVFHLQRYAVSQRYVGTRMTPEQYARLLKKAACRCGVKVTSHSIRHLFATLLVNQQTNLKSGEIPLTLVAVKDLLGHRNIATTVGYIETRLETQREVLKGLSSLSNLLAGTGRSGGSIHPRSPQTI